MDNCVFLLGCDNADVPIVRRMKDYLDWLHSITFKLYWLVLLTYRVPGEMVPPWIEAGEQGDLSVGSERGREAQREQSETERRLWKLGLWQEELQSFPRRERVLVCARLYGIVGADNDGQVWYPGYEGRMVDFAKRKETVVEDSLSSRRFRDTGWPIGVGTETQMDTSTAW